MLTWIDNERINIYFTKHSLNTCFSQNHHFNQSYSVHVGNDGKLFRIFVSCSCVEIMRWKHWQFFTFLYVNVQCITNECPIWWNMCSTCVMEYSMVVHSLYRRLDCKWSCLNDWKFWRENYIILYKWKQMCWFWWYVMESPLTLYVCDVWGT